MKVLIKIASSPTTNARPRLKNNPILSWNQWSIVRFNSGRLYLTGVMLSGERAPLVTMKIPTSCNLSPEQRKSNSYLCPRPCSKNLQ